MKKLLLILIPIVLVSMLSAVSFDISGNHRVRAAMYNDAAENAGGHIDNRLQIGFDSQFHKNLAFRVALEIGDIVWGNGGGGISTNGVNIETSELYLDYMINAIDAKVRFGQQYYADNMGLILDDFVSGLFITKEDWMGMDTEFAWIKGWEGALNNDDDYNVFMAHANFKDKLPMGIYAMYGAWGGADTGNFTLMPYYKLEMDPLTIDVNVFLDYQMNSDPTDDEIGLGAAAKVKADLGMLEVGGDLLLAMENGLTTISPWYQNGLYIYGIGKHHDGANLYWNTPYEGNADMFVSAVGHVRYPFKEDMTMFAAAGYLVDTGLELNAGIEYEIIPDLLMLSGYGAFGMHDNETTNYLLGTTVKVEF